MNKKTVLGLIAVIVIICGVAAFAATSLISPSKTPLTPTGEMDFTVSGQSDCLRFLNSTVPTVYVPFTVATGERAQLSVNCTKMPGGVNGWTDVYVYRGYWDSGANHTCKAMELYPILNDISATDQTVKINQPYTATFGESTQQSYTVFFVIPPGGPSTFHVTFKPL